jgi:2-keto-4-pentenoate hydratase
MTVDPVAQEFVAARLEARALAGFPGEIPSTLEEAYAHQAQAIRLWPDSVAGWKIGRIGPPWLARFGVERLLGPVFRQGLREVPSGESVEFKVFTGGFAAVEAEFVFRLNEDPPPERLSWTAEEVLDLPSTLHVGIETAGSPLASINDLGPAVIVSDFGNNAGLLLGPRIDGWRSRDPGSLTAETFIDGHTVGSGGAGSLPGGPVAALAFALECCARLGRPLKSGQVVSTGATTGIHEIRSGQTARVRFHDYAELLCRAVAARPSAPRAEK